MGFAFRLGANLDPVAMSITGPSERWTEQRMMALAPTLLERVGALRTPEITPFRVGQAAPSGIR